MMSYLKLKDQQNTSLSPEFPCEHCRISIRHLAVGNKVFEVQELLPPIYCTDAHDNIIGLNLNDMPYYALHTGVLCRPYPTTAKIDQHRQTHNQLPP